MNSISPNKKFNVNLISFGRLGFSFAKEFIGEFKNNSIISEFKIWFPENVGSELFIDQLRIITRDQMQFKPKPYRFMSDLKEIVSDSVIDPMIGNITVVCSRFDYSFKSKKIKKDELIKKIIDRSYFNIQDHNGAYQKIKEKRTKIQEIIVEVQKRTALSKNRSSDLIDNIVGTIELAKVFRGYKGNILNAVNEVDTTTKLLTDISGVEYEKVIGLCDNDRLRYENEIYKYMLQSGELKLTDLFVPVFGTHNQFMTAIANRIQIKDKFLPDLKNMSKYFPVLDKCRNRIINVGDDIYAKRGASDLDSATALLNMVKSIVCKDNKAIRASCRMKEDDDFCTGILIYHDNGFYKPYKLDDYMGSMNTKENEIFTYGNNVQKLINEQLAKNKFLFGNG